MRGRILGGGKRSEAVKSTCPYLGLAHDQLTHLPESSSEHRCYLYMQRERIDRSHQDRFCLTSNYPTCPWLLVSPDASGSGESRRPWQQYVDTIRERFDDLERATMRNRWPQAILILLIFVAQLVVKGVLAIWRIASPAIQAVIARLWLLLVITFHRVGAFANGIIHRPALPIGLDTSLAEAPLASTTPSSPNQIAATDGIAARSSIGVSPSAQIQPYAATRWECATCARYNSPNSTFCERCGRLSAKVESDLLAKEDFFTLDGLKALSAGDEDDAHRYFALSTRANPQNEFAWRWQCRTSATVDDLIACLEQMLAANPGSEEAESDLELARVRRGHEDELAAARAAAEAKDHVSTRPSLTRRIDLVARLLLLELASIPAFVLGLLWLGRPVLAAFASVGVSGFDTVMPVFDFPRIMVSLPAALVEPLLPGTFALADVVPIVFAAWYVLLAFRVADGSASARYLAIASALVSLGATWYVSGNGQVFFIAAVCLLVLALVGKDHSRENASNSNLVMTGVV